MTTHEWFAQHPIDIHKQACEFANAAVPEWIIGTPEHYKWLRVYDMAFFRLTMGTLYGDKK